MSFVDQTAIVTGANRGIGFMVARHLAEQGMHVIIVARDEARGLEAQATLKAEGHNVSLRVADVSSAEDVDRLSQSIEGPIHVLVNNAGVMEESVPLWESDIAEWDRLMNVNLRGAYLMCRRFIPRLRETGSGRLVNVSSTMGTFSPGLDGGWTAYRVSKAAVNALTRNLAHEVPSTEVLINAVCPGWVRTEMGGDRAPLTPEEGADTIVYLATLPAGSPSGFLWRDRQIIDW